MRKFFPVILSFLSMTCAIFLPASSASAQTATPTVSCTSQDATATTDPMCVDPDARYKATSEGKRDGFIILANPQIGTDLALYCTAGRVAFTDQVEINGDQTFVLVTKVISCDFKTLDAAFPGAKRVIRVDPTIGWTFATEPDAMQDVVKQCHGSFLISLRAGPDKLPEYKVDPGLPECAGNAVG